MIKLIATDMGNYFCVTSEGSYAVENARESTKAQAKHVCPSYQDKGVYQIIRKLIAEQTEQKS